MRIRPQLSTLASDIDAQTKILHNTRTKMQDWKNSDVGKKQRHIVEKAGDAITIEGCAEYLRPLFDDILWLYDMMDNLCDIQSANPFTNIELRSSKNDQSENIILHQDQKLSLRLTLIKSGIKSGIKSEINSVDNHGSIANSDQYIFGPDMIISSIIKSNEASYKFAHLNGEVLQRETQSNPCTDGQVNIYDNRLHSLKIIPKHSDIIILRAIIKRSAFDNSPHPNSEFESRSQNYRTYCNDNAPIIKAADENISRAQFMFSILREANTRQAIHLFEQWVRSKIPDMRWYVMKEFLALDMESALPHLLHMAHNDCDKAVRNIALGTMQLLRTNYSEIFKQQESISCPKQ